MIIILLFRMGESMWFFIFGFGVCESWGELFRCEVFVKINVILWVMSLSFGLLIFVLLLCLEGEKSLFLLFLLYEYDTGIRGVRFLMVWGLIFNIIYINIINLNLKMWY